MAVVTYYPKHIKKKYCKKCGCLVGYRNSTGYCMHHFGEYNKEKELWKAMTKHNEKYGIWNTNMPCPEETKKKISNTLKETSYWKTHGLNKLPNKHEVMFAEMYPTYEMNKYFGTGLGGKEKWNQRWFNIDFYDAETNTAYEIDGSSHRLPGRKERDDKKNAFLKEKGINLIRYTDKEVENMYKEVLPS